jgi:hypothetical protein
MQKQTTKYRYIFNIRRRKRGTHLSAPRLSVQTPDGLDNLSNNIQNITPNMDLERKQGDIATWIAPAGQHQELEWYATELEKRGFEIDYINREKNRMTVSTTTEVSLQ